MLCNAGITHAIANVFAFCTLQIAKGRRPRLCGAKRKRVVAELLVCCEMAHHGGDEAQRVACDEQSEIAAGCWHAQDLGYVMSGVPSLRGDRTAGHAQGGQLHNCFMTRGIRVRAKAA